MPTDCAGPTECMSGHLRMLALRRLCPHRPQLPSSLQAPIFMQSIGSQAQPIMTVPQPMPAAPAVTSSSGVFVPSPVAGTGSPVITSVQLGSGAGETQLWKSRGFLGNVFHISGQFEIAKYWGCFARVCAVCIRQCELGGD
eukprot:s2028_g6.t1